MPGPTTEVLNDDVKGMREDLHKVEVSLKESIHKVELDVRELSTQVRGLLTAIKLLAVLTATTLGGSIWWGATLTADVRNLGSRMDDKFKAQQADLAKILERDRFPSPIPGPVPPTPTPTPMPLSGSPPVR